MGRFVCAGLVSCMALCLAASAEDQQGELERLRQENQNLKAAQLEQDVNAFLAETKGFEGAQGGDSLKGVTLHAALTSVYQGVLGSDGADVGVVGGEFDLNFDFAVSDEVSLFCYMTANTSSGAFSTDAFPGAFGPAGIAVTFPFATNAGITDGIGVNGTVPTNPGAVTTNEVGVRAVTHLGDTALHWEMGELDPRNRFITSGFADNNKTFIHNSFSDPASVEWITTSAGTTSLGLYMWLELGDQKQFKVSWGWFNAPGQWFDHGQLYIEAAWKGEVKGREMNVKFLFNIDGYNGAKGNGPGSAFAVDDTGFMIGWVWDWWITENVGVFFTGGFNVEDTNPVDYDFAFGFVFQNMITSRPDDSFGVGMVWTHLDTDVVGNPPEETEYAFEAYYKLAMANGKIWVTPHFMFVINPGGGAFADGGSWADDSLFILGVRVYVPF